MADVAPKRIWVVPICSVCGKPVNTVGNDKASRHGFRRSKMTLKSSIDRQFSQEDGIPCGGSGKEVLYKKAQTQRAVRK